MRAPVQISTLFAVAIVLVGAASNPAAAQKTDILVYQNGDRVTGEIKELEIGSLRFSTDPMGTVEVKQREIAQVQSDKTFEIELDTGQKLVGTFGETLEDGRVRINAADGVYEVQWLSVTGLVRLRENFWKRLDGHIDVGVDYLQANRQWDLSLSSEVRHNVAKARWRLRLQSTIKTTDTVVTARRQDVSVLYQRDFAPSWYWTASASFTSNQELSLDARGTIMGGAGRTFITTSRVSLWSSAGLGYSREKYVDQPGNNLVDLFLGGDFQFFVRSGRKTDITTSLVLIPSLSQAGRVRVSADLAARHEFFKDFYVKLSLFETFDSSPPTDLQATNDFGIQISLGWSF